MQEEYNPDLVSLTDDDGNEFNFEILDFLDTDTGRYAALTPVSDKENDNDDESENEDEDEGALVILKVIEDGDDTFFEEIEDDSEYDTVADCFVSRLQDYFEIEED